MDLSALMAVAGGLKNAGELITGMINAKTHVEVTAKAAELQSIILSLHSSMFDARDLLSTLQEENRELKNKIAELESFSAEMDRYKLAEAHPGSVVYALKYSMSNGEPAHYVCANCYQSRKKSPLNCIPKADGWYIFSCPNCKSTFPNGYRSPSAAQYAPENP